MTYNSVRRQISRAQSNRKSFFYVTALGALVVVILFTMYMLAPALLIVSAGLSLAALASWHRRTLSPGPGSNYAAMWIAADEDTERMETESKRAWMRDAVARARRKPMKTRAGGAVTWYCRTCSAAARPFAYIDEPAPDCPFCSDERGSSGDESPTLCVPVAWSTVLSALRRKPHYAAACTRCGEVQPRNPPGICLFCEMFTLDNKSTRTSKEARSCRARD